MKDFLIIFLCLFICWLQNDKYSGSTPAFPLPGWCPGNNSPPPTSIWKWPSGHSWVAISPGKTRTEHPGPDWYFRSSGGSPAQVPSGISPPCWVCLPASNPRSAKWEPQIRQNHGDTCLLGSLAFSSLVINCPSKSSEKLTALEMICWSIFCGLTTVIFLKFLEQR